MTPQAILRARFAELADSLGLTLAVRRQTGKFYFTVTGDWENTRKFLSRSIPGAWMTSAAGPEGIYGLPLDEVERVLAEVELDPALLGPDTTPLRIARQIRQEKAFTNLPILADALEEAGCTNEAILLHCRAGEPHRETCWVIELLLGPDRTRRRT